MIIMNEALLPNDDWFDECNLINSSKNGCALKQSAGTHMSINTIADTTSFFSMRKLTIIYNELRLSTGFEYTTLDSFKHQVLNSAAPQSELNMWQAIASRR
jgi:hypothetical protein